MFSRLFLLPINDSATLILLVHASSYGSSSSSAASKALTSTFSSCALGVRQLVVASHNFVRTSGDNESNLWVVTIRGVPRTRSYTDFAISGSWIGWSVLYAGLLFFKVVEGAFGGAPTLRVEGGAYVASLACLYG